MNKFWTDLEKFIKERCINFINFSFSEAYVLFGSQDGLHADVNLDFITLYTKYYIYSVCKWKDIKPCLPFFINILKQRFLIEMYGKYGTMLETNTCMAWQQYKSLFSDTCIC